MTAAATQTKLGKPFASLPVLKGAKPVFTDNAAEAETFQDDLQHQSKPLPLVPAEDQFESTVGKAMNAMFAKIATGGDRDGRGRQGRAADRPGAGRRRATG